MKGIPTLRVLLQIFTILSALSIFTCKKDKDKVYVGIDSSIFTPCINVFDQIVITSGNTSGNRIENKKTVIYKYKDNKEEIQYDLFLPQLIALEDNNIVEKINTNIRIAEQMIHRSVVPHGLYSEIPDVVVYKRYLQNLLNENMKRHHILKNLGIVLRGYSIDRTQRIVTEAAKSISSTIIVCTLTDGMAQAIEGLIIGNAQESAYITTYSLRGSEIVAEIFSYEVDEVKKERTLNLLDLSTYKGYSDYEIIGMIYAHLLKEIKRISEEKYNTMNMEIVGVPNLQFNTEKDVDEHGKKANAIESVDSKKETKKFYVDMLSMVNMVLANLCSLKFTVRSHNAAELAMKKENSTGSVDAYGIQITNMAEKSKIEVLQIYLKSTLDLDKGENLGIFPPNDKGRIELDLSSLMNDVLEYILNARGTISEVVKQTEKKLADIRSKEKPENESTPKTHCISVYNGVFAETELLTVLHGLGIDKARVPSKSDLASAPIHMLRLGVKVNDKRVMGHFKTEYELQNLYSNDVMYHINNERAPWYTYKKHLLEGLLLKDDLMALVQKETDSKNYKNLIQNFGETKINALQEQIDKLRRKVSVEEFIKKKEYQEASHLLKKMISDAELEVKTDKEVEGLQKLIKELIEKGEKNIKDKRDIVPDRCKQFEDLLVKHNVKEYVPEVATTYSKDLPLKNKIEVRRVLKSIQEALRFKNYLISTEYEEYLTKKKQLEMETAAAEKAATETQEKDRVTEPEEVADKKEETAAEIPEQKHEEFTEGTTEGTTSNPLDNLEDSALPLGSAIDDSLILKDTL